MPLPTGTTGRTRSEAAIEAWKHRQRAAPKPGALDPKIAARVKEILAGKVKKGKGAKKPKAAAKPKGTRQEQANQNRAGVAKQTGMGDLEGTLVRVAAGMAHGGQDLEPEKHDALIKKGLAKRHADGSVTLSPAGRKWKSAADKGDADGANAALSDAKAGAADQAAKEQSKGAAKQEREKAKAGKVAERAAKQKKQQQAQKQKAQARAKITAEKAKAKAAKEKAKADKEKAKAAPPAPTPPAADPSKPKAAKAVDFAIKQSDEERAMFAKMGGGRGKGKGYNKHKSKLYKKRGDEKPASEGGGGSSSSASAATEGHAGGGSGGSASSGGGPGGRATLHAPVSGDMEAHARFVTQKRAAQAARAKQRAARAEGRNKAKANIAKIDAIQKELKKRNIPIARLRELQQQLSDIRSGKAIDMGDDTLEYAIKAGARHSKMDASHLDEAARHLHSAGATCPDCAPGEDDDGDDEDAAKAIKGIMDNPAWYAQHECNDIMQAGSALSTLAMLIQSELSEEDEDDADIGQLVDAARTLIKFIGSELDELEGAAGDAAEGRTAGDVPMAKGIELATLDDGEEIAVVSGYAVKALGDEGLVGGYLVKFGGEGDLSQWRDVFTKATNFGKHTKSDVWVHHRMLPGLGKKQLTNQAELGMDDEGVFVKHLLDLRSSYETKLYGMIQAGKLGWSSGTAPHLVERKSLGDGRHEVTQWTLGLDASYTPMPAGGFVVNAGAMKTAFLAELGLDAINTDSPEAVNPESARRDGVKADDERARRLTLELSLMELEETAL